MTDLPILPLKSAKLLSPEEGHKIFAIGPNCWGKGDTGAEAYRNARAHLSRSVREPRFVFLSAPATAWVDDMGAVCWKGEGLTSTTYGYANVTRMR